MYSFNFMKTLKMRFLTNVILHVGNKVFVHFKFKVKSIHIYEFVITTKMSLVSLININNDIFAKKLNFITKYYFSFRLRTFFLDHLYFSVHFMRKSSMIQRRRKFASFHDRRFCSKHYSLKTD